MPRVAKAKKVVTTPDMEVPTTVPKGRMKRAESEAFMLEMKKTFSLFTNRDKLDCLKLLGVGSSFLTCHMCGEVKPDSEFYQSTDVYIRTKHTSICKECAERIALPRNSHGETLEPTADTVKSALEYLDKPWSEAAWATALRPVRAEDSKAGNNTFARYMKQMSVNGFNGKRWHDGDVFNNTVNMYLPKPDSDVENEVKAMYEVNKRSVIRALGYDPFESVPEEDKPQLYSKLLGFLDESTNEDELKLSAIIEIVQAFNQTERLNYAINQLQKSPDTMLNNTASIKAMADTKNKMFSSALALAKDNGISYINSNKNTKGADTWTGKTKELREMDLRGAEMNAFDIQTAQGIQQVAEASTNAILKELSLDENDYTDIIATQRTRLDNAIKELDAAKEEARIYKRENHELKDWLIEQGLMDANGDLKL